MSFVVQEDGSEQVSVETTAALLQKAFDTWTNVDCGDGKPSIAVSDFGTVTCDQVEYNKRAGNANIVIFRDDVWPDRKNEGGNAPDDHQLARTLVHYDPTTGEIVDADIEVNTANFTFTTSDTAVENDLLSVLTHEIGHFLGLSHTNVANSTMLPAYSPQSIDIRNLGEDDEAAICAVYPPDRVTEGECTSIPRHGFSSQCGSEAQQISCSLRMQNNPKGFGQPFIPLSIAASVGLLCVRRRYARRNTARYVVR